ncbi:unnamed protein product [Brassica oleracea]
MLVMVSTRRTEAPPFVPGESELIQGGGGGDNDNGDDNHGGNSDSGSSKVDGATGKVKKARKA